MQATSSNNVTTRGRPKHTVGVLGKALDVLEEVIWGGAQSIGELATATGVEKAAVYRIVNTLVARGFVVKDATSRKYYPGPRLAAAASWLDRSQDIVALAKPFLIDLRDEFGETVNLGVLVGREIQYLEIVESLHSLRMSASVGTRHPAYSTALGKSILSTMGPEAVHRALGASGMDKVTSHTISDWDTFVGDLEQVRLRGYAIDREENELGAVCVAAPIEVPRAGTSHAISISCPAARTDAAGIKRMGRRLMAVCSELGGHAPD